MNGNKIKLRSQLTSKEVINNLQSRIRRLEVELLNKNEYLNGLNRTSQSFEAHVIDAENTHLTELKVHKETIKLFEMKMGQQSDEIDVFANQGTRLCQSKLTIPLPEKHTKEKDKLIVLSENMVESFTDL